MKNMKIKKLLPLLLAAGLMIMSALCFLGYRKTAGMLLSQQAAERWQGDNELSFAQISGFASSGDSFTVEKIYQFRTDMLSKLTEASFEVSQDTSLIHDAWCGFGSVDVANGQRKGKVSVTAVGGDYFLFHPIKLIDGSYLSPDDLMQDRVLIDRETAWLLFGGEELSGMGFEIMGRPFYVAGVIEREDDRFSQQAYDSGMGIYMHYDAYAALAENASISCYELVMAEPVQGFAMSAAKEKFPIGEGELVDNTYRFDFERMINMLRSGSTRSMHLSSAVYPYWENAARGAEDACLKWLTAALIFAALPIVLVIFVLIKGFILAKGKLEDEYIPGAMEKAQEAWRVRARKRWEKKHPDMK